MTQADPTKTIVLTRVLAVDPRQWRPDVGVLFAPFSLCCAFPPPTPTEYQPTFFWWELAEMLRRFILVGLFVIIEPGTVIQLVSGTLVCIAYFTMQVQTAPYKSMTDGYIAMSASASSQRAVRRSRGSNLWTASSAER